MSLEIAHPFAVDGRGRTATATADEHLRQLIEQVLFTSPGERVHRPEFGTNLPQLLFAPNSPELAAATEFTVQGALQRWLGDRIQVEEVRVESQDSAVRVRVGYRVVRTQERQVAQFTRTL